MKKYTANNSRPCTVGKPNSEDQVICLNQRLNDFEHYLSVQRYSERTIQNYLSNLNRFFQYFQDHSGDSISFQKIELYNREVILRNNYSASYQNQLISALKLFFQRNYNTKLVVNELERPKMPKRMPMVLSPQEIRKIMNHTNNLKHRAIISTIYSSGLRVSELVNLCLEDIDSERMVIHIRSGKGNKSRMVNLSEKLLLLLREYYKKYKPSNYLFEGWNNSQYSTRSVGKLLKNAAIRAGIKRNVTPHMLRHSFATHMVESGTDIHFVQRILGHTSIKTTSIYMHVANNKISGIRSPFDDI